MTRLDHMTDEELDAHFEAANRREHRDQRLDYPGADPVTEAKVARLASLDVPLEQAS